LSLSKFADWKHADRIYQMSKLADWIEDEFEVIFQRSINTRTFNNLRALSFEMTNLCFIGTPTKVYTGSTF
jgi:hypothetical protein